MNKIFCTRSLSEALLRQAEAQDIYIHTKDFISIHPVHSEDLTKNLKALTEQKGITAVFTSKQAIKAITGGLKKENKTPTIPAWNIYCISGATQKAAISLFGTAAIKGTAEYAQDLATLILKEKTIQKVYFFCGNRRRDTLPDKLRAHQIMVKEYMVYETRLIPEKVDQNYKGFLFFSPSAVESFFSLNKIAADRPCFAIGNTTADAIQAHCKNPLIISDFPDAGMMIQTVLHYFKKADTKDESPEK